MRHSEQVHDERTDVTTSDTVPVRSISDEESVSDDAGSEADRRDAGYDRRHPDPVPEDALDDRGSYDDPRRAESEGRRTGPEATDDGTDETETAGDGTGRAYAAGDDPADEAVPTGDDGDRPPFHEPAATPTAFGATSVGDAVAASALAGDTRASEHEVRDVERDSSADGQAEDQTGPGEAAVAARVNASDVTTGADTEIRESAEAHGTAETDEDAGTRYTAETDEEGGPGHEPVAGLPPAEMPAEPATALFPVDAATGFRDRWRDVQLRFVDDPQGATGAARQLVDEAVEALTTALAARRQDLDGWQDGETTDTEQLRVVVRRYREFLDGLLDR